MKRLLLVRPVVEFPVNDLQELGIPQSYLHLAQYVMQKSAWEVAIVDYRLNRVMNKEISPEVDFTGFDAIGVGCSTSEFPPALKLLSKAKELGKVTILGGIFATQNRDYCLSYSEVDYVISGEGEQALLGLLHVLNRGTHPKELKDVQGLSYKVDSKIVHNKRGKLLEEISGITPEVYSLIDLSSYAKFVSAHMMATRGCPYGCNFCSLKSMWYKTYRVRPVKDVVQEMRFLKEAGFKRVHLKDETLTVDPTYAKSLFAEIKNENLDMGIKIKSRIDGITDEDLLILMRKAGVDCIHFGVETVSDDLLAKVQKGGKITGEMIKANLTRVLDAGFRINPVFLLGIPSQTGRDLDLVVSFVEKLGKAPEVVAYCSFWNPHPAEGSFSVCDDITLLSNDLNRFTHKQPVTVPRSLDSFAGRNKIIETFDAISEKTKNRRVNPVISSDYREFFLKTQELSNNMIPKLQ